MPLRDPGGEPPRQEGRAVTAPDFPPPARTRTYILVLVLHAAVITALWTFSRYFGA
jgi:hypothetical protein